MLDYIKLIKKLKEIKFIPSFVCASIEFFCFLYLFLARKPAIASTLILILCLLSIINFYLFIKKCIKKRFLVFTLSVFLGMFLASISYIKYLNNNLPFTTLAYEKNINKIVVCLKNDAAPQGNKYYKANAHILSCKTEDGSSYSSKGEVTIFIPSTFVKQNYVGHSISKRMSEDIPLFCKGMIIEVEGFFAEKSKDKVIKYSSSIFFVNNDGNFKFLSFSSIMYYYRTHSRFLINKLLYDAGNAGYLLLALITANKDFLPQKDVEAFRDAGLSHVLAISGMHLAIIGWLSTFFASIFFKRKILKTVMISICFIFLIFAGISPSLLRSFMMLCIVAIAKAFYEKTNLVGILSFSLSIHLFFFPQDCITLSFILSYGALFGILIFGNAIHCLHSAYIPNFLNSSISASLGAFFLTCPIIALTIGKISFVGIISTCFVSPLVSIFLSFGIISIFLSLIAPITFEVSKIMLNILYEIIINFVHFFALCPMFVFEERISDYTLVFSPLFIGVILFFIQKHITNLNKLKL